MLRLHVKAGQRAQPVTSDHGRAHERREEVSDLQLTNTRTSVAAEMAVDRCTDWQTIHEPKGGRGCVADAANGESREGVAIDGKWGCVSRKYGKGGARRGDG